MQKFTDLILTSVNGALSPMSGASVQVSFAAGGTPTIYSDNGVTVAGNPLTSDSNGRISFYAADGRYTLVASRTGFTTITISDILLEDPANASAVAITGGTITNTPISGSTGAFTTLSASGAATVGAGLAVTGAISATGSAGVGYSGATLGGTTTGYNRVNINNTGGNITLGVDNIAGTAWTGSSAYAGTIGTENATPLNFITSGAVKATLDPSGNLGIGVIPTGGINASLQIKDGIKFPATQVPSTDPNTLDDYREGTWTPSIGGTATYTIQEGYFVKSGKFVYVQCKLIINAIGTGSISTITGLPFTAIASANASQGAMACSYFSGLAAATITLVPAATNNGTSILFNGSSASSTSMSSSINVFASGTRVDFSGVYMSNV
jgi:hypothetical protein